MIPPEHCWEGYVKKGTKVKSGKVVNNCVKGGSSQEEYDAYNKSLLRNDTLPKMLRKHKEHIKEYEEGPKKRNRERSEKKKAEKQAKEAKEQQYIKEAREEIEAEEQRKEKAIKQAIEGERKKYSKVKPKVVTHHLPPLDGNGKVSIKQIKAHLKELKVKGISGKNKEQLMAMLVKALNENRGSGISDVAQKILGALIHSKLFHKVMEKFSGIGDSEQYHGSGIGSWVKNVVKVIKNPIASLKAEPKEVSNMLSKYGNHIIKTINVCRVPINSAVQVALNAITLGKFKKEMTNNNYDKMFHLYALLILDNGVVLLTERNQRVVLKPAPNSAKKAKDIMTVVANVSLNDLINRAVKRKGDAIWKYDPINNNCQRYISSLLKSSNLFNTSMDTFINQKADKLLTGKSHSIATGITNIANIAENLARGGSFRYDKTYHLERDRMLNQKYKDYKDDPRGAGNKSSGFIRAIMARNDDPENAERNESKFRQFDKQGMKVDKMSKATHDVIKKKVKDKKHKEYLLSNALQHQPLSDGKINYRGTYDMIEPKKETKEERKARIDAILSRNEEIRAIKAKKAEKKKEQKEEKESIPTFEDLEEIKKPFSSDSDDLSYYDKSGVGFRGDDNPTKERMDKNLKDIQEMTETKWKSKKLDDDRKRNMYELIVRMETKYKLMSELPTYIQKGLKAYLTHSWNVEFYQYGVDISNIKKHPERKNRNVIEEKVNEEHSELSDDEKKELVDDMLMHREKRFQNDVKRANAFKKVYEKRVEYLKKH
jgi:hypothetical protein